MVRTQFQTIFNWFSNVGAHIIIHPNDVEIYVIWVLNL